jgi:uncharacterized protein YcbK (DUF882 family)
MTVMPIKPLALAVVTALLLTAQSAAAQPERGLTGKLAGAATLVEGAAALMTSALAVANRSDDVMPVVARGTDRRTVALLLLRHDGQLDARQAEVLETLMRCRKTGRSHEVSPGLVMILADLAEAFPGRSIELVSGNRAPGDGAPNSKHFHGHAVDIRIPGVPLEQVRDYLWRTHTSIGLGYYPRQGFIHIDYRPGDPDIAWTATHEGATYHFHPAWARSLRADRERSSRVGL